MNNKNVVFVIGIPIENTLTYIVIFQLLLLLRLWLLLKNNIEYLQTLNFISTPQLIEP